MANFDNSDRAPQEFQRSRINKNHEDTFFFISIIFFKIAS